MSQKGGYNYARHKGCGNEDEKSGKLPGDFPESCPFKTPGERGQGDCVYPGDALDG
jgi:hypothetical protein